MKSLSLILFVVLLGGCSALKGTVLDGKICQFAEEADIEAKATKLLETYPSGTTRESIRKKLIYLHAADATAEMFCLKRRQLEGQDPQ